MLVKLSPDPDQIRWWCKSAIVSFETLDRETAIDMALADLRAILDYLDSADKSVTVDSLSQIKAPRHGDRVVLVEDQLD
jgi:hypothetical protein